MRDHRPQDTNDEIRATKDKIAPRGFEPLRAKQQDTVNKELTKNTNPVLATSLDSLAQIYPDLAELVKLWPDLPEQTRAAVKALVRTQKSEKE